MRRSFIAIALALPLLVLAGPKLAMAQTSGEAAISFGGLQGNPNLPIDVTSQELTVDQAQGTAVFSGDVLVVQGEMRLSADQVRVEYDDEADKISKLFATGNVLLVNAADAAQSARAEYTVASGEVVMMGDVSLIQGAATFTAERFVADIKTGLGRLEGGVTTRFAPKAAAGQGAEP